MLPGYRPKQSREKVIEILLAHGVDVSKPAILGQRGYFRDSMGKPGVNDRGIYDDAIFLIGPDGFFNSFNANTDPSRQYKHGVATLLPGVHPYKRGYHKYGKPGGHMALRPATKNEELPVRRDGIVIPKPGIAINIHKGGYTTTSSEGCQTIYPDQYDEWYYRGVDRLMRLCKVETIPYCLIEQQG